MRDQSFNEIELIIKRRFQSEKKRYISCAISPYFPIIVVNWYEYKQKTDKVTKEKYYEWAEILDHFLITEFKAIETKYKDWVELRQE